MDDLIVFAVVLIVILILLLFVTVVGHGIWLVFAAIFRAIFKLPKREAAAAAGAGSDCAYCGAANKADFRFCGVCGRRSVDPQTSERLRDLAAARRQFDRWASTGVLDDEESSRIERLLKYERERLFAPPTVPQPARPSRSFIDEAPATAPDVAVQPPPVRPPWREPARKEASPVIDGGSDRQSDDRPAPVPARPPAAPSIPAPPAPAPPAPPPAKPWSEVIAAFMEQSNIRWGEIIGGLLIVGCSTALVVSLWNEIARIPMLKFLIFTGVTAALFGTGFYTEHRWKLPTTSRGILTIATLLVPLNFLAIAAVSSGVNAGGWPVLVSELLAPAVFACLVFYAGRVLTPDWPHLLVGGILLTSIGQLLVRHWAGPELGQSGALLLTLLPVAGCLLVTGLVLRRAARSAVDETAANAIFFTLGASIFATALPFGLLLFKTGQPLRTLMFIAPALALVGLPPLAAGMFLWRGLSSGDLAYSRTAATAIAIAGGAIAIVALLLGWPDPASVMPAALINVACWGYLAWSFRLAPFHILASLCLALAALIGFAVMSGTVAWQQTPDQALIGPLFSGVSGQALTAVMVLLLVVAELARRRGRPSDSAYLVSCAAGSGMIGAALGGWFGFDLPGDPQRLTITFAVVAASALWLAYRTRLKLPVWVGAGLFWLAIRQFAGTVTFVRLPWQISTLLMASSGAVISVVILRRRERNRSDRWAESRELFGEPFKFAGLVLSFAVVIMLLQAQRWESTAMIDGRILWLAATWVLLLSVIRSRLLFLAMQVAVTAGVALAIKLVLQNFEWYAYLPHAFLHPWGLQLQGAAIVVTGLIWLALRRIVPVQETVVTAGTAADLLSGEEVEPARDPNRKLPSASFYLHAPGWALDRMLTAGVAIAFGILSIYAALPGVAAELSTRNWPIVLRDLAGFPHAAVFGAGAWILGGLLLVAFVANGFVERRRAFLVGAAALVFAVGPLLAARWESATATASAWRWLSALILLGGTIAMGQRRKIAEMFEASGIAPERFAGVGRLIRGVMLALGITPVLIFTLVTLRGIIVGEPIIGPASGLFSAFGPTLSYTAPLVFIVIVLVGFARRERSNGYTFAAGSMTVFTIIANHLIAEFARGIDLDRVTVVQVFQLAAISASGFVLLWLAIRARWIQEPEEAEATPSGRLPGVLLGFAGTSLVAILLAIGVWLFVHPTWTGPATIATGGVRGWLGWLLTISALWWWARAFGKRMSGWAVFGSALSLVSLLAFTSARWSAGSWRSFHVLLLGTVAVSTVMLMARRWTRWVSAAAGEPTFINRINALLPLVAENWNGVAGASLGFGIGLTVVLSMGALSDPGEPWWTIGPLLACAALALGFSAITGQRKSAYAAWGLGFLAANTWLFERHPEPGFYSPIGFVSRLSFFSEWLSINAVAACLVALFSLLIELRRNRRGAEPDDPGVPQLHKPVAFFGLGVLVLVVAMGLYADAVGFSLHPRPWFAWTMVGSLLALLVGSLWDGQARYAVAGIYLTVLGALGVALDGRDFSDYQLAWIGTIVMAGYALLTSALWATRSRWRGALVNLRLPVRSESELPGLKWLLWFNESLATAVIVLGFQVVTIFAEPQLRILCAVAVTAQLFTFGWLAAGKWRPFIQRIGLAVGMAGSVLCAWSLMDPDTTGTWLNRAVVMMVVLVAWLAIDGLGHKRIERFDADWARAGQWLMPTLAVAAGCGLGFVLLTEVAQQLQFDRVMTGPTALTIVAVTLLGAVILCIYFALSPAHDPLQLTERWRSNYVYAAEVILALLFVHIRLTLPELFTGVFAAYWPFVVIGIAFAGIAVSELLRRRGHLVLAEPLRRTGAFLPLLPAVAFWVVNSRVDYSAVLFSAGLVYASLSLLRRSFGFGLLAALAVNGGLWHFLQGTGSFRIDQHPQAWFIPAALSVLVATHINRDRFTNEQMTGLRYGALSVIYVSSTVDIFLNGVARSPWLPLVLAGLAIAGVLCGVAFRVRAFLILGALFLLIAVTTMIRYAQVSFGWTWLWYIAGIVAGGLILLTFALFEKKRRELTGPIEEIGNWEP